ncbi:K-like protein [Botryosphaeria dothidea]|uniref:K-like protein n=1 Tax=Botryosphaeria dothidea TaxID=55169 RepID=A0A8H4J741_9PEZI|nr:K-like protein [Botryosphaeria dothidea]
MPEEGRKRSRFDQTEPEPKRQSRFDRRSRSPSSRQSEARRSRSPLNRQDSDSPATQEKKDPAAAAAAAAARINAQIQARKGIQHVDVPPIRSTASPVTARSPSAADSGNGASGEVYQQDGDYIKDIEVNDLRNRYTLTKGSTQKMIKEETGADVTTRGEYYPDKSLARPGAPPLYLHVTSTTKEGLEKAIVKIEELMKQELPNLVDERRFRRREPEQVERDEYGRRKWPEEKIPVDLEPIPGFNLRAQVVGHGGAYVKHIQQETRCRVQIKGRGSGFIEHNTGQESDEPMYLHVAGPNADDVQKAKELCEDLLANVRSQYEQFKERGPSRRYGDGDRYSGGGRNGSRQDSYGSGYGGNSSYGGASSYGNQQSPPGYGSAMSPTSATTPATPSTAASDPYAAYAQYYAAGGDPYAAYGGYQNYVNMYYQYAQQQQQQQASAPPGSEAPPPPPGSAPPPPPGDAPPPPPPSGSPPGGYSAVPPPPGL